MTTSPRSLTATLSTVLATTTLLFSVPASAAELTPSVISECPAGYFCVWSGTTFSGNMQKISATNSYRSISLTSTRSFYNHRSQRTWLHAVPDGGGSNICVDPGVSKASTTGWQANAEAVYLATITNC